MAKILTGREVCQIVLNAPDLIDDGDQYEKFITELAVLITEHFGGSVGLVQYVEENINDITVAIRRDDNVPSDGGVYKDFDKEGEL